jgi:hypothetical protein
VSHIEILIASFAAAQNLGEISVDARRLEGGSGFAQKERDGLRGLVRRLRDFLGVGVSKFADGRAVDGCNPRNQATLIQAPGLAIAMPVRLLRGFLLSAPWNELSTSVLQQRDAVPKNS